MSGSDLVCPRCGLAMVEPAPGAEQSAPQGTGRVLLELANLARHNSAGCVVVIIVAGRGDFSFSVPHEMPRERLESLLAEVLAAYDPRGGGEVPDGAPS